MRLNITQAAKVAGVSRKTLYRDRERGKLTVGKNGKGQPTIDVAELERVYGPLSQDNTPQSGTGKQHETHNGDNVLQREIELLREQITLLKEERDDLRQDRDDWKRQAKEQVATVKLLTDQHEERLKTPVDGPLTLWQWLGIAKR